MQQPSLGIIKTNDADIVSTRQSTWDQPGLEEYVGWSSDEQTDYRLDYERTFNKSHIKAFMLYESYQTQGAGIDAETLGFPVYPTDQWWATSTQSVDQYISNDHSLSDITIGRRSWVGQAFYDYDEKYIASAAYRYDGSMNFAPNERWGLFPSGSVGWIISKEKFMQNVQGIDLLKVSASAALVGNDAVGGWQWQQSYQNGNSAYFGTTPSTNAGVTYGGVPNPNLTWEKSFNMNYAVDIDFLSHFSSRLEYWRTNTYDILGQRIQVIPPTFSLGLPDVNYGKQDAACVDLSFSYHTKIGQVNFNTGIVASYGNSWIVTKDEAPTYPWQNTIGASTSQITGYKVLGMIRTQADLNNLLQQDPNYTFNGIKPALGQFIYADLSGPNGVKDGNIDNWDQAVLRKNNNPIVAGWNLGASWNGFSVAATFNGMFHYWKSMNDLAGGVEWQRLWDQWATNSWMPTNRNATLPKRYSANDGTSYVYQAGSDFWYKDASFISLKNLAFSYNVPQQYCTKLGVQGIRLYVSGSNLFIISKFDYKYYDPEMNGGRTGFPIIRSFNFGATLSL